MENSGAQSEPRPAEAARLRFQQPEIGSGAPFFRPGPRTGAKIVTILIAIAVVGLAVVAFVLSLAVGTVVIGVAAAAFGARWLITRLKAGPREQSLRRNVHVIPRED